MSNQSRTRQQSYAVSRHVAVHQLSPKRYALWNALFPSVLVVDVDTWHLIRARPSSIRKLSRSSRDELLRRRIIFQGDADPYEAEFFASAEAALARLDKRADEFYRERRPYRTLALVNSGCNLGCPYCVSYKGDSFRTQAARVADKGEARIEAVKSVIDQFMQSKLRHGDDTATLAFNGGEILLRWSVIEPLIRYTRTTYPSIHLYCDMNTNATLISDEIARALNELGVHINVSIDGYREAHNATRRYHVAGRTSFDDVIDGINRYNEHNSDDHQVKGFQGTIEDVDAFEFEKFFAMSEMGFEVARLAPNLLDKPEEYGERAATWEATMVVASQTRDITTSDTQFQHLSKLLEREPVGFAFHCNGLQGVAAGILTLNIDSMQLSQMCSFSSPGAVPLSDLQYDIYNPELWQKARQYIVDRIEMLRSDCAGCSVLGACQGACVHNGLTLGNRRNPASCQYQRQMWHHVVEYAFDGTLRAEPRRVASNAPVESANGQRHSCLNVAEPKSMALDSREGKRVWTLTPVS